mgnify:CR=1 FL=1
MVSNLFIKKLYMSQKLNSSNLNGKFKLAKKHRVTINNKSKKRSFLFRSKASIFKEVIFQI